MQVAKRICVRLRKHMSNSRSNKTLNNNNRCKLSNLTPNDINKKTKKSLILVNNFIPNYIITSYGPLCAFYDIYDEFVIDAHKRHKYSKNVFNDKKIKLVLLCPGYQVYGSYYLIKQYNMFDGCNYYDEYNPKIQCKTEYYKKNYDGTITTNDSMVFEVLYKNNVMPLLENDPIPKFYFNNSNSHDKFNTSRLISAI